jgi:phage terminase large subunit
VAKVATLPASSTIDWKNPDYQALFDERSEKLERLRAHPEWVPDLKLHYRNNPADFINDWGVTFDPRNADIDRPSLIPFILTPRQREWIDWIIERWRSRTNGINEKSRDMGVTWLAVGLSCTLCLFRNGVVVGFGSRKAEYVDEAGTLKPILPKARMFMRHVPREFRGDWTEWRDAPQMRINFPDTGSLITGEGGDEIGRGDRTSIYFVDEAAHLPRPLLVDAALSQTTNCRIDMSSVNGMNNPFAQKRWGGKVEVFIFDWREDPRKDDAWYQEQVEKFDPVVVAQEIDRDYSASVQGIVIPGAWVRSAINAREKLALPLSGLRGMSLDVADEGTDKNAVCRSHGVEIVGSEEWSGKGSDIFATVQRAFNLCDEHGYKAFDYDADGLGADVRGDARVINDHRRSVGGHAIAAVGWRGSEAVVNPDGIVEGTHGREGDKGRTNKDFFMNRKAQGWWALRRRFQRTYRWVVEGTPCEPDEIVSISSKCPSHMKLVAELSQPTYQTNGVGKIVIDKKPNGMKSPNLGDAAMIRFAPKEAPPAEYTQQLMQMLRQAGMRRRRGR